MAPLAVVAKLVYVTGGNANLGVSRAVIALGLVAERCAISVCSNLPLKIGVAKCLSGYPHISDNGLHTIVENPHVYRIISYASLFVLHICLIYVFDEIL